MAFPSLLLIATLELLAFVNILRRCYTTSWNHSSEPLPVRHFSYLLLTFVCRSVHFSLLLCLLLLLYFLDVCIYRQPVFTILSFV